MTMKIKSVELQSTRISKDYTIELPNGKEVIVNKYVQEDTYGDYDSDFNIISGNADVLEWINEDPDLDDEREDQWHDFISKIDIFAKD